MDKIIEETLQLSPLFVTLSQEEKNKLIQTLLSNLSNLSENKEEPSINT